MRQEHIVPLAPQAVAVLRELRVCHPVSNPAPIDERKYNALRAVYRLIQFGNVFADIFQSQP
jgi:hypothetical protein